MSATETRRILIGDWNPPNTTVRAMEAAEPLASDSVQRTQLRLFRDGESIVVEGGVRYQRCGGGRRVIRKGIGSN